MGNRASIYIQPSRKTLYLQWQGGPGSIDAFIDEAKKRAGFTDKIQQDFIFYLHHCIRDFNDFSTDVKYRHRDQLSLYVENGESVCDQDNGHYILRRDGTVTRERGKYCYGEDTAYSKKSNAYVSGFFANLDKLLLTTEWGGAA